MGSNWVWCGICAKYVAFGAYPTSAVGALMLSLVLRVGGPFCYVSYNLLNSQEFQFFFPNFVFSSSCIYEQR